MQNLNRFKEDIKQAMKEQLRKRVSISWDKYLDEAKKLIDEATDSIISKVFDETKIEELAKSARAGATYVVLSQTIEKVVEDALNEAKPMIEEFVIALGKIMLEASGEAIKELIREKLQQKFI